MYGMLYFKWQEASNGVKRHILSLVSGIFRRWGLYGGTCLLALMVPGCSVKKIAINSLGNALSEGSSTFAKDDDPELVGDAVPFALKTIEMLIEQAPKHQGLLTAACSGFTQYSYAFVQQQADFTETQDLARATEMRTRAKKLYLRAVNYGMRGLEVEFPGFHDRVRKDPDGALAKTTRKQVPLLYYTAGAWAAAFALDVTDSELSVNQTAIEKMMTRALALDENWESGTLHDFFISWEAGHASTGGSMEKAREHYLRARELSAGKRVSPLVSYAESVLVSQQKKREFEELLNEALKFDIAKAPPEQTLSNVLSQRRAKWLLSRIDELF
jgi:predicted anti-sigma-YlaC factor YlaD